MSLRNSTATLAILCATASFLGPGAAAAVADGDPASDVLVGQPLFLAGDATASATQQQQLSAALAVLARHRLPLRVAIIASPADLGSVTELWRLPREYARFLGQELGLVYRGTLLVAMPNGFGIASVGATASAGAAVVPSLPAPEARESLVTATMAAVRAFAAADGQPILRACPLARRSAPTRRATG